jgi:hypothetical protein
MCGYDPTQPYVIPLEQRPRRNGKTLLTCGLVLGKVTSLRNGEHSSGLGFKYPIGRTVHDPKAVVGNHASGLHFAASPASAHMFNYFGSHRLAVLPAPEVWDPVQQFVRTPRCYHSRSATTICCLDCDRIEVDVLNNPDFIHDLMRPRSLPGGLSIKDLLAENLIWHQRVEVNTR